MSTEASVQVITGAGPLVRTIEATVVQTDGSTKTVEIQVVALTTASGKVIDLDGKNYDVEILGELTAIRKGLEEVLGMPLREDREAT